MNLPTRKTFRTCPALLVVLAGATWQATTAQSQSLIYLRGGNSDWDRFGESVRGAGDVDGDGVNDFIVGAPGDDNNGEDAGAARVYSGANGALLHSFFGDASSDRFGNSVSGAGDVDGDGFDDLIVGAQSAEPNGNKSGIARVFSGLNGTVLYTFEGSALRNHFGHAVAGAGDVDGDGFHDLVVGANGESANGIDSGAAHVFSGSNGALLYSMVGSSVADRFGSAVGLMGDLNGDGVGDLVVGAYSDNTGPTGRRTGSARVVSGVDGTQIFTVYGDSRNDWFGWSVSAAGDVDGDGIDDLIVGAFGDDNNGSESGSARVFSGVNGAVLFTLLGNDPLDYFGRSVSGAGDVNGDGTGDLVVGATGGSHQGRARVFSGPTGVELFTFRPNMPLNGVGNFGSSVSGLGDVNGDGFDDILVGASVHQDSTGGRAGAAYVLAYAWDGASAVGTNFCAAEVNSTAQRAHISATGTDLVANNDLTLAGESLPTGSFGYFLTSPDQSFVERPGGSQGNLCIASTSIGRFVGPGQIQSTGAGTTVSLLIDLTNFPQPAGPISVMAGETWNFQYWYRDFGPVSNLTDALRVEFQ